MNKSFGLLIVGAALLVAAAAPTRTDGVPPNGSIVGTITASAAKSAAPLKVDTDREFCGEEISSEAVVATAKGHVRYAVVSLDGASFPGEPTAGQLRIANQKCAFAPHVQTGTVGSTLNAFNEDGVLHNVRLFLKMGSKRRSLVNLALPAKAGPVDASRATRWAGTVEVTCDAHTWMSAYVVLFDHPYHAVTDAQGSFAIENVPPGTYPLKVWHESLGELVTEVVVEAGEATTVALQFN